MTFNVYGQATLEESKAASTIVGKWLSKGLGHYDFLSATPLALKKDDYRFYIYEKDHIQFSSEYGFSYMQVPVTDEVLSAYNTLGFSTSGMSKNVELTRFHVNLGFTNRHELTFHYQQSFGGISGWGGGYKHLFYRKGRWFFSHRISYANAGRTNYFNNTSITNDLSLSFYLRLIDFYVGIKHSLGKISFEPSATYLALPAVEFTNGITELEYYYGVVISTSHNIRITVEFDQFGNDKSIAAKLSFHFDSLLPKKIELFTDPRYIKIW